MKNTRKMYSIICSESYPSNFLRWMGIPVIDTDKQYDRIDNILSETKASQYVRDLIILRFIMKLSWANIKEQYGMTNSSLSKWFNDEIKDNELHIGYLSLDTNTLYNSVYDCSDSIYDGDYDLSDINGGQIRCIYIETHYIVYM